MRSMCVGIDRVLLRFFSLLMYRRRDDEVLLYDDVDWLESVKKSTSASCSAGSY